VLAKLQHCTPGWRALRVRCKAFYVDICCSHGGMLRMRESRTLRQRDLHVKPSTCVVCPFCLLPTRLVAAARVCKSRVLASTQLLPAPAACCQECVNLVRCIMQTSLMRQCLHMPCFVHIAESQQLARALVTLYWRYWCMGLRGLGWGWALVSP
jgi:hypothetical protein